MKDMLDKLLGKKKPKETKKLTAEEERRAVLAKEKEEATKNKQPWVGVLDTKVNPENIRNGFFELDWNDKFIEDLMTAGYTGEKDEEVINKWFNDLCRNIMLEDMDEDVVDALKENIKENKKELGDGKVEYS